jgi:hypothetical protein
MYNRLRKTILSLFLVTYFFFAVAAYADVVTHTLQGTITDITATNTSGQNDSTAFQNILPFSVGSPIITTIRYDTNTPPDLVWDVGASYDATYTIQLGSTIFNLGSPQFHRIQVINSLQWDALYVETLQPFDANGWGVQNTTGYFYSTATELRANTSFLQNTQLPLGSLNASSFFQRTLNFEVFDPTDPHTLATPLGSHRGLSHRVLGTYSSISSTVPEPASPLLLSIVLCNMILLRNRHTR